jgi:hypothetical protein
MERVILYSCVPHWGAGDTMTLLRAERPTDRGSIPGEGKTFSLCCCAIWLIGPPGTLVFPN